MIELFRLVVEICGGISIILAMLLLFIKPLREKFLTDQKQREGMKCLLRGRMLNVYYKNKDNGKIRQYEYENFCAYYESYKALGGNSFITHIAEEVFEWEVVS